MNKTIIAVVIVVVIVLGGYFLFKSAYQPVAPVIEPSNQQATPQPSASKPSTQQPSSQSSTTQTPAAKEGVVTYTDAGYLPASLRVKVGEMVTFKNQSSRSMWTASAVHPTHRVYPTTGGCLGSTFDACQGVQPGSSWSFKFNIPGTWKYHNHLNPSNIGAIIVE